MPKFTNSDRNDQTVDLVNDTQLNAVVGGTQADDFAKFRASYEVGGWFMKDIWTRPTLGRFT
jgi:hypothetical protein